MRGIGEHLRKGVLDLCGREFALGPYHKINDSVRGGARGQSSRIRSLDVFVGSGNRSVCVTLDASRQGQNAGRSQKCFFVIHRYPQIHIGTTVTYSLQLFYASDAPLAGVAPPRFSQEPWTNLSARDAIALRRGGTAQMTSRPLHSDLVEDLVAHGIDELLDRPRAIGLEKCANAGKDLLRRVGEGTHVFWNEFLVERSEIAARGGHPRKIDSAI